MTARFEIKSGFPEDQRAAVARLYWQAFGEKLGFVLGPEARALRFFTPIMEPRFCLTVQSPEGKVLGVAGYKTAEGGLAQGGWADLTRCYGWIGAVWRALLLSVLERTLEPGLLLMDGIVVSPEAQGQGFGGLLLEAICQEAQQRGLRAVRLDVIDSNPRARALYERKGFVALSDENLGPFAMIFGFKSATRMERAV